MDTKTFFRKVWKRVIPNLIYIPQSRFRICGCCRKPTLFVSLSKGEERNLCIRCMANSRYEMLAEYLREYSPNLHELDVVELDHRSPLRNYLADSKKYVRTYFSTMDSPGFVRYDGAQCEDITHLTFADESIDILISSDVLEHVADIAAAFSETSRVLRSGGFHLFTVPPCTTTIKRAEIVNSELVYLLEPEFHSDPLNPEGILAFWSFGLDLGSIFSTSHLKISLVDGPRGRDQRVLWKAEKIV